MAVSRAAVVGVGVVVVVVVVEVDLVALSPLAPTSLHCLQIKAIIRLSMHMLKKFRPINFLWYHQPVVLVNQCPYLLSE